MDFFSKLGDSIVSATQEVGEKAKGMTDVAKLQYEMRSKEDFLNKQYQENKDAAPEAYTSLFEEVVAAQKRIEEIKEQIAYTKGGKACPKCGAVVSGSAAFCSKCGAKMDEDIFLDDFTLKEVSDTLQVPIDIVKSSGQDLIDAILGVAGPNPTDIDENQMKDRRITTA